MSSSSNKTCRGRQRAWPPSGRPRQPSYGLSAPCGARQPPSLSLALSPGQWAVTSSDDRGEGLSPGRSETAEMRQVRRRRSRKKTPRNKKGVCQVAPESTPHFKISLARAQKWGQETDPLFAKPAGQGVKRTEAKALATDPPREASAGEVLRPWSGQGRGQESSQGQGQAARRRRPASLGPSWAPRAFQGRGKLLSKFGPTVVRRAILTRVLQG